MFIRWWWHYKFHWNWWNKRCKSRIKLPSFIQWFKKENVDLHKDNQKTIRKWPRQRFIKVKKSFLNLKKKIK